LHLFAINADILGRLFENFNLKAEARICFGEDETSPQRGFVEASILTGLGNIKLKLIP
jgi:hypothetical protein